MLKPYLIILNLFISLSVVAQHYKLDSVLHTVNGRQSIAFQKYDALSKKAEIIRYERIDSTDSNQTTERMQIDYDEKGNEIRQMFAVWDPVNKTWDEEEKTEKEFNPDNSLTRMVIERKKNNRWIKEFETIRSYNKDSIIEIDYELKEDKLRPIHKSISVVNVSNKAKTEEIFLWDHIEQDWRPHTRTENDYQRDTILASYKTFVWEMSQWKHQEKVIYELDTNGFRTDNYIIYNGNGADWIPSYRFEEIKLPKEQKQISSSYVWLESENVWQKSSEVERFLNEQGNETSVLFSEYNKTSNQFSLSLERMILYDKQGRVTLRQGIEHMGEHMNGVQNTIKFDEEGNVISENSYELDVDNDTWCDTMMTEFFYNKNIVLNANEDQKNTDFFNLNQYYELQNKHALEKVKVYRFDGENRVLVEKFEYFYSIAE